MADLNEVNKTVELKKWDRANKVVADNTFNQPPSIDIQIEHAQLLDGVFSAVQGDSIRVVFDPSAEFPLINPLDDSPIGGTGTHIQLQVLLYSLFKSQVS